MLGDESPALPGRMLVVEAPDGGLTAALSMPAASVSAKKDAEGTHVDLDMDMTIEPSAGRRLSVRGANEDVEMQAVHAQGSYLVSADFDEALFDGIAGANDSTKLGHLVTSVHPDFATIDVDLSFPAGADALELTADFDDDRSGGGRRLARRRRRRVTSRSSYKIKVSPRPRFGRRLLVDDDDDDAGAHEGTFRLTAGDGASGDVQASLHLPSSEIPDEADVGAEEFLDIAADFELDAEEESSDIGGGRVLARRRRRRVKTRSSFKCPAMSRPKFGRRLKASRRLDQKGALGDHAETLGHFTSQMNDKGEVQVSFAVHDGAEDLDASAEWDDEVDVVVKCTTDGGYAKAKSNCRFPFKYGGKTYNDCASMNDAAPFEDSSAPPASPEEASRQKWCSTVRSYSRTSSASRKKWGFCQCTASPKGGRRLARRRRRRVTSRTSMRITPAPKPKFGRLRRRALGAAEYSPGEYSVLASLDDGKATTSIDVPQETIDSNDANDGGATVQVDLSTNAFYEEVDDDGKVAKELESGTISSQGSFNLPSSARRRRRLEEGDSETRSNQFSAVVLSNSKGEQEFEVKIPQSIGDVSVDLNVTLEGPAGTETIGINVAQPAESDSDAQVEQMTFFGNAKQVEVDIPYDQKKNKGVLSVAVNATTADGDVSEGSLQLGLVSEDGGDLGDVDDGDVDELDAADAPKNVKFTVGATKDDGIGLELPPSKKNAFAVDMVHQPAGETPTNVNVEVSTTPDESVDGAQSEGDKGKTTSINYSEKTGLDFSTQAESKSVTTFKFDVDGIAGEVKADAIDPKRPKDQGDVIIDVHVEFPSGKATVTQQVVLAPTAKPTSAPTKFPTAKPTKLPTPFPTKKTAELTCDTACHLCEGKIACGLSEADCSFFDEGEKCLDSFTACSEASCELCNSEAACVESRAGYGGSGCAWREEIPFEEDPIPPIKIKPEIGFPEEEFLHRQLDGEPGNPENPTDTKFFCEFKVPPTSSPTRAPTYDQELLFRCDLGDCSACTDIKTCLRSAVFTKNCQFVKEGCAPHNPDSKDFVGCRDDCRLCENEIMCIIAAPTNLGCQWDEEKSLCEEEVPINSVACYDDKKKPRSCECANDRPFECIGVSEIKTNDFGKLLGTCRFDPEDVCLFHSTLGLELGGSRGGELPNWGTLDIKSPCPKEIVYGHKTYRCELKTKGGETVCLERGRNYRSHPKPFKGICRAQTNSPTPFPTRAPTKSALCDTNCNKCGTFEECMSSKSNCDFGGKRRQLQGFADFDYMAMFFGFGDDGGGDGGGSGSECLANEFPIFPSCISRACGNCINKFECESQNNLLETSSCRWDEDAVQCKDLTESNNVVACLESNTVNPCACGKNDPFVCLGALSECDYFPQDECSLAFETIKTAPCEDDDTGGFCKIVRGASDPERSEMCKNGIPFFEVSKFCKKTCGTCSTPKESSCPKSATDRKTGSSVSCTFKNGKCYEKRKGSRNAGVKGTCKKTTLAPTQAPTAPPGPADSCKMIKTRLECNRHSRLGCVFASNKCTFKQSKAALILPPEPCALGESRCIEVEVYETSAKCEANKARDISKRRTYLADGFCREELEFNSATGLYEHTGKYYRMECGDIIKSQGEDVRSTIKVVGKTLCTDKECRSCASDSKDAESVQPIVGAFMVSGGDVCMSGKAGPGSSIFAIDSSTSHIRVRGTCDPGAMVSHCRYGQPDCIKFEAKDSACSEPPGSIHQNFAIKADGQVQFLPLTFQEGKEFIHIKCLTTNDGNSRADGLIDCSDEQCSNENDMESFAHVIGSSELNSCTEKTSSEGVSSIGMSGYCCDSLQTEPECLFHFDASHTRNRGHRLCSWNKETEKCSSAQDFQFRAYSPNDVPDAKCGFTHPPENCPKGKECFTARSCCSTGRAQTDGTIGLGALCAYGDGFTKEECCPPELRPPTVPTLAPTKSPVAANRNCIPGDSNCIAIERFENNVLCPSGLSEEVKEEMALFAGDTCTATPGDAGSFHKLKCLFGEGDAAVRVQLGCNSACEQCSQDFTITPGGCGGTEFRALGTCEKVDARFDECSTGSMNCVTTLVAIADPTVGAMLPKAKLLESNFFADGKCRPEGGGEQFHKHECKVKNGDLFVILKQACDKTCLNCESSEMYAPFEGKPGESIFLGTIEDNGETLSAYGKLEVSQCCAALKRTACISEKVCTWAFNKCSANDQFTNFAESVPTAQPTFEPTQQPTDSFFPSNQPTEQPITLAPVTTSAPTDEGPQGLCPQACCSEPPDSCDSGGKECFDNCACCQF